MRAFNFFKKNPVTHEGKVSTLYNKNYKNNIMFPGKEQQISNIIQSLSKIFQVDLANCSVKDYDNILSPFIDIYVRRFITHAPDSQIIISLQVKHNYFVKNEIIALRVLIYCKLNMSDNSYVLNSTEDLAFLDECCKGMTEHEKMAVQNVTIQESFLDDPDYGRCASKPIFTDSPDETKVLLNKLRSTSGETLIWKQSESIDVEGISGKVYKYDGFLSLNEFYNTLYINEYGINAKWKIPAGFTNPTEDSLEQMSAKDGYYFENAFEFAAYIKKHKELDESIWLKGTKYLDIYKKGYKFFDCGNFAKAIYMYKESLKFNPIGLKSRFELIECYIGLHQLKFARKSLYEMVNHLVQPSDKARFYRRLAYIAVEEKSYKEAYACCIISMKHEQHPKAYSELKYIESKTNISNENIRPENILKAYKIPILQ